MSHETLKPERPNWLYKLTIVLFPGVFAGLGFVFGPLFTPGHSSYGQFEYLDDSKRWAGVGALLGVLLFVIFKYVVDRTTRSEPGPNGLPVEPNPADYISE